MRRTTALLVALSLVATGATVVLGASAGPADAACSLEPTRGASAQPGPLGPIGVLGDSTAIGMIVYGNIVGQLADRGWGPIRAESFCGGRTADGGWSAITALASWRADGFDPPVILMGFGSNDVGFCQTNLDACQMRIDWAMDAIGNRDTVWPTITHNNLVWQDSWNQALVNAVADRPLSSIVDWKALVDADPSLVGADRVHARDVAAYVERAAQLVAGADPWAVSRQVSAPAVVATPTAAPAGFAPLAAPVRVLDTRSGRTPLAPGVAFAVDLAALAPAGTVTGTTTAAAVNLTVDRASGPGYLTAWSCNGPVPPTSVVDYPAGAARAAHTIVPVVSGRFCVTSSAPADLVVDLAGLYATGASLKFTATAPQRLADTRQGSQVLPAGTVTHVPIPVANGTPPVAVMFNLTATDATAPGFATAYPCGATVPAVSSVNVDTTAARANLVQVGGAANGEVCVFTSSPMNVVVDLVGTYGPTGLRYQPVVPTRLLDTRVGLGGWLGAPASGQTLALVTVSPTAAGVVLAVTSTDGPDAGYVAVHPCASGVPGASTLNHVANETVANTASLVGAACVTAQHRDELVVDLTGRWVT
jgi:hypothetical protein